MATALIVYADHPLDNKVKLGKKSRGTVRIVVETDSDPIYAANRFKLDKDHWLLPGQEIEVTLDPKHPDDFEIDWDAIPSIEERVAADDPTLTDPLGMQQKMEEKIESVTNVFATQKIPIPDSLRPLVEKARSGMPRGDRFKEAMDKAAQAEAPPGKQRAVVLVATRTATLATEGGDADGGGGTTVRTDSMRGNDSVLSVNVPGMAPYAVFKPRLKRPRNVADVNKSGFPALVSSTDPTDVEILWDEMPSAKDQVNERLNQAMQNALQNAMPAGTQEAMAANAVRALKMMPPAQRQMMIQQYRAAGIEIDEADLD